MREWPFKVLWDGGDTFFFCWNWENVVPYFAQIKAAHFFGLGIEAETQPEAPTSMQIRDNPSIFKARSTYLTTLRRDSAQSGVQYSRFNGLNIYYVKIYFELNNGSFERATILLDREAGASGPQISSDGQIVVVHLGCSQEVTDGGGIAVMPQIDSQVEDLPVENGLPARVLNQIAELRADPDYIHFCSIGCEARPERAEASSGMIYTLSPCRRVFPVGRTEIDIAWRTSREVPSSGRPGSLPIDRLSAIEATFFFGRGFRRVQLLLKGPVQNGSEPGWMERIVFFAIHRHARIAVDERLKMEAAGENRLFKKIERLVRQRCGLEPVLSRFNSGSRNFHVVVRSLADIIEEHGERVVAGDGQEVIEFDIAAAARSGLVPGDRFGLVAPGEYGFTGPANLARHVLGDNTIAVFDYLWDNIRAGGADEKDEDTKVALRRAREILAPPHREQMRSFDPVHRLSEQTGISGFADGLALGLAVLQQEFLKHCTFSVPEMDELIGCSAIEILSFLALIETSSAAGRRTKGNLHIAPLRLHRSLSNVHHVLSGLGVSTASVSVRGDKRAPAISEIARALGFAKEQAAAVIEWTELAQLHFMSILGNPASTAIIMKARVTPDMREGDFEESEFLKQCAEIDNRLTAADIEKAVSWGIESARPAEIRQLARRYRKRYPAVDGWPAASDYVLMESLFRMSREGEVRARRYVEEIIKEINLGPGSKGLVKTGGDARQRYSSGYLWAKAEYERALELGVDLPARAHELFRNGDDGGIAPEGWEQLALNFEERITEHTGPKLVQHLVDEIDEWAGVAQIVSRISDEANAGRLGVAGKAAQVSVIVTRTLERAEEKTRNWFEASPMLSNARRNMDQRVTSLFSGMGEHLAPQFEPGQDAVQSYARIMLCYRFISDFDTCFAAIPAHLKQRYQANVPTDITRRLIAIAWLRDALPESAGVLSNHYAALLDVLSADADSVGKLEKFRLTIDWLPRAVAGPVASGPRPQVVETK